MRELELRKLKEIDIGNYRKQTCYKLCVLAVLYCIPDCWHPARRPRGSDSIKSAYFNRGKKERGGGKGRGKHNVGRMKEEGRNGGWNKHESNNKKKAKRFLIRLPTFSRTVEEIRFCYKEPDVHGITDTIHESKAIFV